MNDLPLVAIIGRANVGKSSLFNRLVDQPRAITAREPGTTRDSVYEIVSHERQDFWLVDTAGLKDPEDEFEASIQDQVTEAAQAATALLVVVDGTIMVTDEDRQAARMALRTKKPVLLAVNKSDKASRLELAEFQRLGIKTIVETSAQHARGIHELLAAIKKSIPPKRAKKDIDTLRVALVGRPNVGKSHLFNTLVKKQTALVAEVAGTTRDMNVKKIRYHNRTIELIDTAGIRRSGKTEVGVEKFSLIRTIHAISTADICLLLVDVNELATKLDQKIAGIVKEAGRGLIVVVSKWDSIEKDSYTQNSVTERLRQAMDFVPWAPVVFTSATTGQHVAKLFDIFFEIAEQRNQSVATTTLNKWLSDVQQKHPPASLKGRPVKFRYAVQTGTNPPTFRIFGTRANNVHWSYRRYMEKQLRMKFDFHGTPIIFEFSDREPTPKHKLASSDSFDSY